MVPDVGSSAHLGVGLIGFGSIGATVAERLLTGEIAGCRLTGVLRREGTSGPHAVASVDELVLRSDIVVEAAGHTALRDYGVPVLQAGKQLLVVSVGALADDKLRQELRECGGDRLYLSTGAIGGLDILRAAMMCAPLETVHLSSSKVASALVRPWMDSRQLESLHASEARVPIFSGTAREAAQQFPQTANVAATVALATIGLDSVTVGISAWQGPGSEHIIRAKGPSGAYEVRMHNSSAPDNPKSSWVTAFAVLRALTAPGAAFRGPSETLRFV